LENYIKALAALKEKAVWFAKPVQIESKSGQEKEE